jgi:putative AdoMet-dependent methyltransferase
MSQNEMRAAFDEWAPSYDEEIAAAPGDRFPFAGYREALSTVWREAGAAPGSTVLDLGVGTGELSRLFLEAGCQVTGADFSAVMLQKTREKFPEMDLVQVDLTQDEWPQALDRRFEHVVSNYTLHEFPFETKLRILERLAKNHLAPGGHIVVGDVAFLTEADRDRVREEAGDEWEEEFFWTADETRPALETAGWRVAYQQLSICAGVYAFTPPSDLT